MRLPGDDLWEIESGRTTTGECLKRPDEDRRKPTRALSILHELRTLVYVFLSPEPSKVIVRRVGFLKTSMDQQQCKRAQCRTDLWP